MLSITRRPDMLLPLAKAADFAAILNGNEDDDWTYEVDKDPKGEDGAGFARVKIFDEDGEFVSFWSE